MDDRSPSELLTAFVLARIAEQPVEKQVLLYRAFAVETRDRPVANDCRKIADALQAITRQQRQLALNFKRRAAR